MGSGKSPIPSTQHPACRLFPQGARPRPGAFGRTRLQGVDEFESRRLRCGPQEALGSEAGRSPEGEGRRYQEERPEEARCQESGREGTFDKGR